MESLTTKQLRFDLGPRELVRLLQSYAKAQTGPFCWQFHHEGHELGLYLIVQKSNKDGFECLVKTILRQRPGSSFLADDGEPVATLHGTRVRDGETLMLIKCPNPKTIGSIFVNVALGMESLQKELAKPAAEPERQVQIRVEQVALPAGMAVTDTQPAEKVIPPAESPDEEPWMAVPDHGWDRQALELWWEGYTVGDVASHLSLSEKTVRNRLTALRQAYGAEIVPRVEGLRKAGRR